MLPCSISKPDLFDTPRDAGKTLRAMHGPYECDTMLGKHLTRKTGRGRAAAVRGLGCQDRVGAVAACDSLRGSCRCYMA